MSYQTFILFFPSYPVAAGIAQLVWWLGYGLEDLEFDSRQEQRIFLLSKPCGRNLRPNNPTTARVPGSFLGGKRNLGVGL